jgi:HD-GYP domain-containing protein (c-di-GMP phosphodiesterase class II)
MISNRPYRKPLSKEEAKKELLKWAGKQFDPNLVSAFLYSLKETEEGTEEKDQIEPLSLCY